VFADRQLLITAMRQYNKNVCGAPRSKWSSEEPETMARDITKAHRGRALRWHLTSPIYRDYFGDYFFFPQLQSALILRSSNNGNG
jgi:hypothetical protein